MKVFIFRCRARPQLQAASRYETGSNLPTDRCAGGWEFVKFVELSDTSRPRVGVDLKQLRLRIHDDGWHVWEVTPEGRDDAPPMPPTMAEPLPVGSVPRLVTAMPAAAVAPPPPASAPPPRRASPPPAPAPAPPPRRASPPSPAVSPPPRVATPPPTPRPAASPSARPAAPSPPPAARPASPPATPRTPAAPPSAAPATRRTPVPPPRVASAAAASVPSRPAARTAADDARPASSPAVPASRGSSTAAAGHRVVWFDVPVRDIDRAARFYAAVLGTTVPTQQAGPGIAIAMLTGTDGTPCGALVQSMDVRPSDAGPLLYLSAEGRLDAAVAVAETHGGRILQPRHSIAPYGFRAILLDTEGNRVALHSMT